MLSAGTKVARYGMRTKIGECGMSKVNPRARDEKMNRDVAIKMLPSGLAVVFMCEMRRAD